MSQNKWYKLDNTAKLIPSMTTEINPNVFRLSCTLKEEIEESILNEALIKTLEEFPMFNCSLKSGLFWHYLETNNKINPVHQENKSPCTALTNGLLYRVTYYQKRINLEVYHVLSDGNGAMEFLKYLVCTYLNIKHHLKNTVITNESTPFEKEKDDFQTFDKSSFKFQVHHSKKAYKLKLQPKDNSSLDVIEIHLSTKELKTLTKQYNVTITTYLTAILIKSILSTMKLKDYKKNIGITIPVDLRKLYPSKTSRNFFYTVLVSYKPNNTNNLEDIMTFVKEELHKQLSPSNIQNLFNSYMIAEHNFLVRIIPNFIKDLSLNLISKYGRIGESTVLSNLGLVSLPSSYTKYITSFQALSSTEGLQLTICSYQDDLALSFTSHFLSKDIERNFILELQQNIKNIHLISNVGGDNNE